MGSNGFWQELRRRHACRVAAANVVVGCARVQASTQVFPMSYLPTWVDPTVVLVITVGLPIRDDPHFQALLKKYAGAQAAVTSAAGP